MVRQEVTHLGKYFDIFNNPPKKGETFWFRGHARIEWDLTPSALRYDTVDKRNRAIDLLADFKRYAEMKLERPPGADEQLKWIQLARHYGLPTRLLDWTTNAAVALYCACSEQPKKDGAVFVINPAELNRRDESKTPRVLDPNLDAKVIKMYLELDGKQHKPGLRTIAINPTWNSERIVVQQGVFTIAGSESFTLTSKEASSLVHVRITKEYKGTLLDELERVGVNEMALFPELEHTCSYLKKNAKLGEDIQ
jgi:hypothetical protein